jgi:type I restriction enzyme M protein
MSTSTLPNRRLRRPTEIAKLVGVELSTLSNWRKRHAADFPKPDSVGKTPLYRLDEIQTWMATRRIPKKFLYVDEPEGTTYGDRMLRNIASAEEKEKEERAVPAPAGLRARRARVSMETLLPLAGRVAGREEDFLWLVLSLLFLLDHHGRGWWHRKIRSTVSQVQPQHFLQELAKAVDKALRDQGVSPTDHLNRLPLLAPKSADLVEVVELCGELETGSYQRLLDEYERVAKLDETAFFTPESVARLMARLALPVESTPSVVLDPYARGGELLAAVTHALAPEANPEIHAHVLNEAAGNLTCMRLSNHHAYAKITVTGMHPWRKSLGTKADSIVVNPPFNSSGVTEEDTRIRWEYATPRSKNLNYTWVQHALACLTKNGRAAVLMPTNANSSANSRERNVREALINDGSVEAVITLPSRLFPTSNAVVSIWLLRRPSAGPILMVDARKAGEKISPKQRALGESAHNTIVNAINAWREDHSTPLDIPMETIRAISINADQAREADFSLNPPDYLRDKPQASKQRFESLATAKQQMTQCLTATHQADSHIPDLDLLELPTLTDRLPDGWTKAPLHTLCTIQAGPTGSRISTKVCSPDGEVPVVAAAHLSHRRIIGESEKKLPQHVADSLHKHRLRAGDILCVRSGKIGHAALVTSAEEGWIFQTNLLRLHDFTDAVDPRYLVAYLSMPALENLIKNRSTTVVPSSGSGALGQLTVVLPPPHEQERIGNVFAAIDDQLQAHQAFIEATAQTRNALANHILGDVPTA